MKCLILGDGILGSEIEKITGWDCISRRKNAFDFSVFESYSKLLDGYDTIINCIAYTNTYDDNRDKHWSINVVGTSELVDHCAIRGVKLIQISTDYVYSNSISNASENDVPVHCRNWYGYTKLVSDAYVQLKSRNFLLVRCTHKKTPFPYDKAYINQCGNFDYVDIIAKKIVNLIISDASGVINVGTNLKTMYDLALRTNKSVTPVIEKYHLTMPDDISMNIGKLNHYETVGIECDEHHAIFIPMKEIK